MTDIIIGWNGLREARGNIFGAIIDQVLEHTDQQVLVCKLSHPVNTSKRLFLVLPPGIDYNPGFFGAVHTVKQLSAQLGAELEVLAVQGDTVRLEARFDEVPTRAGASFRGVTNWNTLPMVLRETLTPEDVLVVLSARRGTVAHVPQLDRLPGWLSRLEASFIMLYPSEQELTLRGYAGEGQRLLANLLHEERCLLGLAAGSYAEVVQALLATTFDMGRSDSQAIAKALMEDEVGYATEVLPGFLLSHARVRNIKGSMLFLGVLEESLEHEQAREPAHVVALLLSSLDVPPQQHLSHLSELALRLARAAQEQDLVLVRSFEELKAWLLEAGH